MRTVQNPIHSIDWRLLRQQKQCMVDLAMDEHDTIDASQREHMEGIIHLLDNLQDYAVDSEEFSESEVFGARNSSR